MRGYDVAPMRVASLLFTLPLLAACGGAPAPSTARAGEFHGPNTLEFAITSPVQRQMPPERHRGTAQVTEAEDGTLTLELRMFDDGDVCRLDASPGPTAETFDVRAGQQCRSRFAYDGSPVAAIVEIDEGTVRFEGNGISVALRGRMLAHIGMADGPTETEGMARWSFEGVR